MPDIVGLGLWKQGHWGVYVGIALHLAMCALIGGFIYFTRDWTIRLFNSDPAVVEQGRVIITYLAPCYFLFSATAARLRVFARTQRIHKKVTGFCKKSLDFFGNLDII